MNLVALMIARNELGRYLGASVASLLTFCDQVMVWDDGSDDGTREYLEGIDRVQVRDGGQTSFYKHEGQARQRLLDWGAQARPTHIVVIDADEIVENGHALRAQMEDPGPRRVETFQLGMQEVWGADQRALYTRQDGGWRQHPVPIAYKAGRGCTSCGRGRIANRALASGRVPLSVARNGRRVETEANVLHFGWTNVADRQARYDRYVEHDGGRFHKGSHLESIMFGDDQVSVTPRAWPTDMDKTMRAEVLARVRKGAK
jgi:hypothetical protein